MTKRNTIKISSSRILLGYGGAVLVDRDDETILNYYGILRDDHNLVIGKRLNRYKIKGGAE